MAKGPKKSPHKRIAGDTFKCHTKQIKDAFPLNNYPFTSSHSHLLLGAKCFAF